MVKFVFSPGSILGRGTHGIYVPLLNVDNLEEALTEVSKKWGGHGELFVRLDYAQEMPRPTPELPRCLDG